jgi:hypothetical protein
MILTVNLRDSGKQQSIIEEAIYKLIPIEELKNPSITKHQIALGDLEKSLQ